MTDAEVMIYAEMMIDAEMMTTIQPEQDKDSSFVNNAMLDCRLPKTEPCPTEMTDAEMLTDAEVMTYAEMITDTEMTAEQDKDSSFVNNAILDCRLPETEPCPAEKIYDEMMTEAEMMTEEYEDMVASFPRHSERLQSLLTRSEAFSDDLERCNRILKEIREHLDSW